MNIRKIVYVLLGCLMLFCPTVVWGQAQPEASRIDMDVVYGFKNNLRSSSCVPVRVTLTCSEYDFYGKITLEIPVQSEGNINSSIWMSDIDGMNNKEHRYVVEKEIFLKAGETREEIFYTELPSYAGYIQVTVYSDERIAAAEEIYCDNSENDTCLLLGVISENTEEISELNGIQVEMESYYGSDIFVKAFSLEAEDIYDNPLALEQLDVLIVDKNTDFTQSQKDAIAVWEKNGGLYFERDEESLDDIFHTLYQEEYQEKIATVLEQIGVHYFSNNEFDSVPVKKKTAIEKYVIIILLYLVAVGPGLYCVLKHKKNPGGLVGGVSFLAVSFSLVIYFVGRDTNMSAPVICYSTLYEQKDEYMIESVEFAVQAYQQQNYGLTLDKDYYILPQNIGVDGIQAVDEDAAETVTIFQTKEENHIFLENMSAYRQNCFSMERYEGIDSDEQIQFNVQGNGDCLQIQWKNPTEYSIGPAILVLENRIAVLGEIEAISEGVLEDCDLYSYESSSMSLLLEEMLDFSACEYPEYQLVHLANVIWKEQNSEDFADAFVIGIIKNTKNLFETNAEYEVYGNSLIKIDVEINWLENGTYWCPNLEIYGVAYKGEYSQETNLLHSKEAILDYRTDFLGDVTSIEFFPIEYLNERYHVPYEGKIYLFNWQTGTFVENTNWKKALSGMALEPYISDMGVIRVYYVMDEWLMNSNRSCVLPCIKASGKVENDAAD